VYAEADSDAAVDNLLAEGREIVEPLI